MALTTTLGRLTRPLTLGIGLLHEATHLAAATPWLDDWEIVIGPTGSETELSVFIEFDDAAPWWAVALAYLAPALVGVAVLVGVVAVGVWVGLPEPVGYRDTLVGVCAATAWWLYAWPSEQDVAGAVAAVTGGDKDAR